MDQKFYQDEAEDRVKSWLRFWSILFAYFGVITMLLGIAIVLTNGL